MAESSTAIVKKGKACIKAVDNAMTAINCGCPDDAIKSLAILKEDSIMLAKYAQSLASKFKKKAEDCKQKCEDIQRQIQQYAQRENELKRKKRAAEEELTVRRNWARQMESALSQAEDDLRSAERRRREKEKDAEIGTAAAIGGSVAIGILTFGIGTAVGIASTAAAAGAATAIIIELKKEEERAKGTVNNRRSDVSRAQSDVRSSESEVQRVESEISNLSSSIRQLEQQCKEYHEEAGELKKAAEFVTEAVYFWNLFQKISENGTDRTDLLSKLAEKASKKTNLKLLRSGGGQRIAGTFLEAWEEIASKVEEGEMKYVLSIED